MSRDKNENERVCIVCGEPAEIFFERSCPGCCVKQLAQSYIKKDTSQASVFYNARKGHFTLQISCANTNWQGDKFFHIGTIYRHAIEWLDGFVSMCSVSGDGVKPYFRHEPKEVPSLRGSELPSGKLAELLFNKNSPSCCAKQLAQSYIKKDTSQASVLYNVEKEYFMLQISCVNTNWRGDKLFHIGRTYDHAVEWFNGFIAMCSVIDDGVKPYFRHEPKKVPRHGDKNHMLDQKFFARNRLTLDVAKAPYDKRSD